MRYVNGLCSYRQVAPFLPEAAGCSSQWTHVACTPPGKSWWGRGLQALRLAGPAVGIVLFVSLSGTVLAPTGLFFPPQQPLEATLFRSGCVEELLAWDWPRQTTCPLGLESVFSYGQVGSDSVSYE